MKYFIFFLLLAISLCFAHKIQENSIDSIKAEIRGLSASQKEIKNTIDSLSGKFASEDAHKLYSEAFTKIQNSYNTFLIIVGVFVAILGIIITIVIGIGAWNWWKGKKYNEEMKKDVEDLKTSFEESNKKIIDLEEKSEKQLETQKAEFEKEIEKLNPLLSRFSDAFTDPRDGRVYHTVKIGNQIWMAENLKFNAFSERSWVYAYINNEIYYDWEAAKNACPPGWHLPSQEEWRELVDSVGEEGNAGEKLKSKGCGGTDEFKFSAFMFGYYINGISFSFLGKRAFWWTSTEFDSQKSYVQCIDGNKCYKYEEFKKNAFSIRCIQDQPPAA
jgi:uncharacterized protein (TIGR02145 family)